MPKKKIRLGLTDGVIIRLINPKAYAVGLALFSGFPPAKDNMLGEILIKFTIVNSIFVPAYFLWLLFGEMLYAPLLATKYNNIINVTSAVLMIFSVMISAFSIFPQDHWLTNRQSCPLLERT